MGLRPEGPPHFISLAACPPLSQGHLANARPRSQGPLPFAPLFLVPPSQRPRAVASPASAHRSKPFVGLCASFQTLRRPLLGLTSLGLTPARCIVGAHHSGHATGRLQDVRKRWRHRRAWPGSHEHDGGRPRRGQRRRCWTFLRSCQHGVGRRSKHGRAGAHGGAHGRHESRCSGRCVHRRGGRGGHRRRQGDCDAEERLRGPKPHGDRPRAGGRPRRGAASLHRRALDASRALTLGTQTARLYLRRCERLASWAPYRINRRGPTTSRSTTSTARRAPTPWS